jgi:hypothetical protein
MHDPLLYPVMWDATLLVLPSYSSIARTMVDCAGEKEYFGGVAHLLLVEEVGGRTDSRFTGRTIFLARTVVFISLYCRYYPITRD